MLIKGNCDLSIKRTVFWTIANIMATSDYMRQMVSSPEFWQDILFQLNGTCRELKAEALTILHNFLYLSKPEHSQPFLLSNHQVRSTEQFIVVVMSCFEDNQDADVCRQALAVLEVMLQIGAEWTAENKGYETFHQASIRSKK